MQLISLSSEDGNHMTEAPSVSASPQVSTAARDTSIARGDEAGAAPATLGTMTPGGGANTTVGARRSFAPSPAGRISV